MHPKIRVRVNESAPETVPVGTRVRDMAPSDGDGKQPWIAALVNHDLVSLTYPLAVNSDVRLITAAHPHGWRVYRWSVCYLLAKAIRDRVPDAEFAIEHAMGPGLYCTFNGRTRLTDARLGRIRRRMHDLVERDIPIERHKIAYREAVESFDREAATDKLHLLQYRNPPHVVLYRCDGFDDLAHGPLAPSTGMLSHFELFRYPPGFILQLPSLNAPQQVPSFEDQPHLFEIFREHKHWGRVLGVTLVGQLNRIVMEGRIESFIQTAEALHEKKLANIADRIATRRPRVRVVLIAGPSSAGKTTFAKRLATHLRVNGIEPMTLSTDDYFVGEAHNPLDADGRPDYEHIHAVDVPAFNHDLRRLIRGDAVPLRRFQFENREPVYPGETLRMGPDQVLVIEGIHGLNPALTARLDPAWKFRIYVNALTQLNVDRHNRISTTDNRLIRRMVRDHRFRGHRPLQTLTLWPKVRRGEERWIFPFQREADATFNSALDYELAVLKPFAEPLLMQVKPDRPEYAESRRLTEFLLNFVPVQEELVPRSSILREYIGGSALQY